jgi:hypothetical protein
MTNVRLADEGSVGRCVASSVRAMGNQSGNAALPTRCGNTLLGQSSSPIQKHTRRWGLPLLKEMYWPLMPIPKLSATRHYLAAVLNRTAWHPSRYHAESMLCKKGKREPGNSIFAHVRREMAEPRMAKSARIAKRNPKAGAHVKFKVRRHS